MAESIHSIDIQIGPICLESPILFPSVSSVKTALAPLDYVRVLNALIGLNGQYLVSAYDLCSMNDSEQKAIIVELSTAIAAGAVVLMDSGNYESYWKNDQSDWAQERFHHALQKFPCSLAFGFDEQNPPEDIDSHVSLVCERYSQDQGSAASAAIIPIIHGRPEDLPLLCSLVAMESGVQMLAVPERRLGNGVFDRARSVASIREALDKTGRHIGLHLLGTGNPISLTIFAIAGANSFDGLEWCQTVVDHDTGLLHHLSQVEFFRSQTTWGDSDLPFHPKTLAHNLEFLSDWMRRLKSALRSSEEFDFCRLNFPRNIFNQCADTLKWDR